MATSRELDQLGKEYWDWKLESDPVFATYLGDHRWNDRLADIGVDGRKKEREKATDFLGRLKRIDRAKLPEGERVTHDIMRLALEETLDEQRHKFYQWGVDQLMGPQVSFFEQINYHPFRNEKDVRDLISRFDALPKQIDDYIANLREGVAEKRVAPNVAVARVLGQLREIAKTPAEKSPLAEAIGKAEAIKVTALKGEILRAIEKSVKASFAKLQSFLEKEYRGRDEVGVSATPGGLDAYQFRCRAKTTTDISFEELHRIGLEEVTSIRNEMAIIAKKLGHSGDIKSFIEKLKNDPANQPKSRDEVLEQFRSILKKAEAKLPEWFGRLPKNKCIVKPVEEYREKDCVAAYYYAPDAKLTRNGVFYANTYHPEGRLKFNAAALTIHEAVPGHHLQIALAMEIEGIPEFRRQTHFTAYVEGWALYTERLAEEMGLYENDLERFGMLTYQALRACRLVVDTGLHAKGWSRQKAIDFMMENVADSEGEIVNEIDRYIIWPGQALAYKVGQREIHRIREEARLKLGAKFDIRAFHDVVLKNGALPLSTLKDLVDGWVNSLR